MKKLNIFIFFSLIFILTSCRTLYDVFDNTTANFKSVQKVHFKEKNLFKDSVKYSVLWVGHATCLIQIYDKVILTDPFLTKNVSFIQRRLFEPGIDIDDLKKLDLITISHSHTDHLNFGSLRILEDRFTGIHLAFPDMLENFLPKINFKLIKLARADTENKKYIGEAIYLKDSLEIITVSAYHWAGRYGIDGLLWNENAFTGFIIKYKDVTIYFAGDTAYDDEFFKYLGNNFDIDVALVPIGPCKTCEEIDKPGKHVYPKGALKILEDTKAKLMIPIHYGTLREKSDPFFPAEVLKDLLTNNYELKQRVKILNIGEQYIIKDK